MINNQRLLNAAITLAKVNTQVEPFQQLIDCIQQLIPSDAIALLTLQGDVLKPHAIDGLTPDTLGRRFVIKEHPRLQAICNAKHPLQFAHDCPMPDPYDGLLSAKAGDIPVHACLGMPLFDNNENLLGVLTLDSLNASAFDNLSLEHLTQLSTLCAAHLHTTLQLQQYQSHAQHSSALVQELNREALTRDGVEIIGQSPAMQTLKNDIKLVAASEFSVLIQGDTGVGKELVARNIHLHSKRSEKPLIHLNCASLPENLAESEFFGHAKGAFTGAESARQGKFQLADGGTLFLDEIGELPLAMQSKLLRVLQSGEIQTVGEDEVKYVDVRVIAATNRNLKNEVAEGRFRADLYHRLSVYPLIVAPLSERENDVILLAGYFVEQTARKLAIKQLKLSVETQLLLTQYDWPGNVRELEHVISRAALKAKQAQWQQAIITITPAHCDLNLTALSNHDSAKHHTTSAPVLTYPVNSRNLSLKQATDTFTHHLISQQLEQHDFNWAATARTLHVDRANLVRLAKRLGIAVKKSF
ncbi:anaerobic nitric oxide reductase transcription regulator [Pseudoalteromonas mariniglutinosa NCIMB 1770]|nr:MULTISPECIES: nitric oxide reductase transcriptional regulator NorR [Pseudoalteromonas]MCF6145765.1 anaerobic nitric oxide reductase transcription regulator [Pseudoalteromonas mariniglutinosa NCIMB 1770]